MTVIVRPERLWQPTDAYPYPAVIDYSRAPVMPGAGSAFCLHATIPAASQGRGTVQGAGPAALPRWLRPSAHPRIALGPLDAVLRM